MREPGPQGAEDRRQHNDEERVHVLEPRGVDLPADENTVRVIFGEQVHRRAGLLESSPEDGCQQKQPVDDHQALLVGRDLVASEGQQPEAHQDERAERTGSGPLSSLDAHAGHENCTQDGEKDHQRGSPPGAQDEIRKKHDRQQHDAVSDPGGEVHERHAERVGHQQEDHQGSHRRDRTRREIEVAPASIDLVLRGVGLEQAGFAQVLVAHSVLDQPEYHPEPGDREAQVPVPLSHQADGRPVDPLA